MPFNQKMPSGKCKTRQLSISEFLYDMFGLVDPLIWAPCLMVSFGRRTVLGTLAVLLLLAGLCLDWQRHVYEDFHEDRFTYAAAFDVLLFQMI
jgi:hypothetical protein